MNKRWDLGSEKRVDIDRLSWGTCLEVQLSGETDTLGSLLPSMVFVSVWRFGPDSAVRSNI